MSAAARAWYARIVHLYRPPQLRPLRRYVVQLHPILGYLPIRKHIHVAIIYRNKIVDFITRINVAITLVSADYNVLSSVPFFVPRSEEHTSELQSRRPLVCRPLLYTIKHQR